MIDQLMAVSKLLHLASVIFFASFPGKKSEDKLARALWQQKKAIRFLDAFKVKVRLRGDFPTQGLIVCNHLSYIDILAIASQGPVVFVAKSDLAAWPVIGNLMKRAGTILAYRDQPLKTAQTAHEIQAVLDSGLPVVLFPEGTSTNGESVKTFRSSFFQSAQTVSANVTPAAIMYTSESGDPKNDICYWGDHTFLFHILKLLTLRKIVAWLSFGDSQACLSNRKDSAVYFHKEVSRLHRSFEVYDR